jgi:hypothetical protein
MLKQRTQLKRVRFKRPHVAKSGVGGATASAYPKIRDRQDIRGSRSLRVGKKGRDWIAVRRRLSAEFAARGIVSCELGYESCWGQTALGWAHGRKRRHLKDNELETLVILSCNPCHDKIEYLPPAEMLAIVQDVISNRRKVA